MIEGKVVGLGFEIISKLDSYSLMTVSNISSFFSGDLYDMEREDPVTRSVEEPGYYPAYQPLSTGAGCHIHWKESVIIEHKDTKTTVCTKIDV